MTKLTFGILEFICSNHDRACEAYMYTATNIAKLNLIVTKRAAILLYKNEVLAKEEFEDRVKLTFEDKIDLFRSRALPIGLKALNEKIEILSNLMEVSN